ncbi:MAG: hypothetical protein DMG57_26530 [Acidobacteria bacterium]|nr:MAG: hypothetical protein DMG57_26530 [Acidobacteriota bacterium]
MSTTYLGHERRFSTVKVRAGAALLVFLWFVLVTASGQAQSSFVYTNNNEIPNTVTAFSVGFGGTLMMVPGSPFMTGGDGFGFEAASNTAAATMTMRKRFLYVSNTGTNNISGFSIDTTTGALTLVPGSPFATRGLGSLFGISLAVTPNGKFLYAGNAVSSDISAFSVGSNGALTPVAGSPFVAGDSVEGIKVSPNGRFLGVALPLSDSVAMFSIGSNGALASVPGSPFHQGGSGGAAYVDMSCNSKLLFAALGNAGPDTQVGVSTIASSGALSPIAGSPFTFVPGANSSVGILSPNNQWLFVSNQDSSTITSLDVESNGSLAQVSGSPFSNSGGIGPNGMATNAQGTLLYVANGDNTVTGFSIDNSNGSLSPVLGNPFVTGGAGFLTSLTTFPAKRVEGEGDENGDDGHKGHFRFEAERECKASSGVEFEERDTGKGMKGSVDTYTVVGNTATITGAGTLLDGTPVTYTAVALGNAPIIGANRFAITWITATGSVFQTSGALIDGYIAVHP